MRLSTFILISLLQFGVLLHATRAKFPLPVTVLIATLMALVYAAYSYADSIEKVKNFSFKNIKIKPIKLPKRVQAWLNRKPQSAQQTLEELYNRNPSLENVYQLATSYFYLEQAEKAYQVITNALQASPLACPKLRCLKVRVELKLGYHQSAFDTLKPLIPHIDQGQKDRMKREIQLLLAKTLEANHHYEAALLECRKLLKQYYDFETHYQYIHLLKKMNQVALAKQEIMMLVDKYKKLSVGHKKTQKKWVVLANKVH